MKKKSQVIVATLMGLIGIVFYGQGIGLIGGSFMTGENNWAVIGAIMVLTAAVIFWFAMKRRGR